MQSHEKSYLQGRLKEIENQKRLKMAEIEALDKQAIMLQRMVKGTVLPVIESCGIVAEIEPLYVAHC